MSEFNEKKLELELDELAKGVLFDDEPENGNTKSTDTEGTVNESSLEEIKEESMEISIDEYKSILNEHFQNLRTLIKYTKTKDETICKLSNELQKYREDYCAKTFKSIATLLISFREDCRRSLSDLDSFELTFDKARKFISFLGDDCEELLSNVGCEENDGKWNFNGKPLTIETVNIVKCPSLFEIVATNDDNVEEIAGNNIREYLINAESKIKLILADNEKLDKCLKDYCTLAMAIENDIVYLCVYPSIRKLISLYNRTKRMIDLQLSELNEENMVDRYRETLSFLVEQMEDVLLSGGVKIDTTMDEFFDTKKNKLVSAVVTNDKSLDRKIVKQYTECYTMNEVVIYPAKVDVYKYQV